MEEETKRGGGRGLRSFLSYQPWIGSRSKQRRYSTLMINTLHFFPAPLFRASVIHPSLVFNIPPPNLDSQFLPGPTKSTGHFLWGLRTTERLCHLADLARSLALLCASLLGGGGGQLFSHCLRNQRARSHWPQNSDDAKSESCRRVSDSVDPMGEEGEGRGN